jgi:beta-xylosidase
MANNPVRGQNPLLRQDYPDPDVIRVEDTYYMISTTMHFMPGGAILRSYDLIHWEMVGYVYETLDDTPEQTLEGDLNIYGKGMWAASLRYHKGMFFVCFVCNETHKTYLYESDRIEGPWRKRTIEGFYHDCSLFFDDDDRVYIIYGNKTIRLTELNETLTAPKKGGLNRILVEDKGHPGLGYEGSHFYKINGNYYVFLIHSLREQWFRTEACFFSNSLQGEFKGGDVLCDDMGFRSSGVAQGGIVDTPEGKWFAVLFQDRGAVGRIPVLVPIIWRGETPVFGKNGKVPAEVETATTRSDYTYNPLYVSDDFIYEPDKEGKIHLNLVWQWNHTPRNDLWSVTERKGALRLKSGKICKSLTQSYNTLAQRTTEDRSAASVTIDASAIKDGDFAGIAALQGNYGAVAITREQDNYFIVMLHKVQEEVIQQKVLVKEPLVTLKCQVDYRDEKDEALFFYEVDGVWVLIGIPHKLVFQLDHFTGCRFGLFYYSTRETRGMADFMKFDYECNG